MVHAKWKFTKILDADSMTGRGCTCILVRVRIRIQPCLQWLQGVSLVSRWSLLQACP